MRGLVAGLCAIMARMVFIRWKTQDEREGEFHAALGEHRKATEEAFREFRGEFMAHLDRLRASSETSMAALNQTMAEVARTAGEIRARMAERYATKEDLAALEERLEKRFELCKESCPPTCKG
jgi:chromosome segregation ATPase